MTGKLLRIIGGVGAAVATASVLGAVVIAGGGESDGKRPDRSALPLSEVVLPADEHGLERPSRQRSERRQCGGQCGVLWHERRRRRFD